MAKFDKIPETEQDLLNIAIQNGFANEAASLLSAYRYAKTKHKSITTPFSLTSDSGNVRRVVKVLRIISSDEQFLKELKVIAPSFSFTPGDGLRSKRGLASKGVSFEAILEKDIKEYINHGEDGDIEKNNLKFIKEFWSYYNLNSAKQITVSNVAGKKYRRPIKISGSTISLGNGITDIGEKVADILVKADDQKIYLSLKLSGFSYFNLGIATFFPEEEIKSGKITNKDGLALLEMYGIDNEKFCKVFNTYKKPNAPPKEEINAQFNSSMLTSFIKQAVGKGYHFVRKLDKGQIEHYKMDNNLLTQKTNITNVKVIYPYGTAKKIYIIFGNFTIEMRNTAGGLRPTFMIGYYTAR